MTRPRRFPSAASLTRLLLLTVALFSFLDLVPAQTAISLSCAERLARGIKVDWFGAGDQGPGFFNDAKIRAELQSYKSRGFKHLRFCLHSDYVNDPSSGNLRPTELARIKQYVDLAVSQGLAVILDPLHGGSKLNFSNESRLFSFWTAFASYFKDTDPNWVFLELYNEPCCNATAWDATQRRLLAVARQAAPHHTFLLTASLQTASGEWDHMKAMIDLTLASDPNVVYSFHFYDPFCFTHKCALKLQPCGSVNSYPGNGWDKARLRALLIRARDWSRTHNVLVHMGEFGADWCADSASKVRWNTDVVAIAEEFGFAWTVWWNSDQQETALRLRERLPAFTTGIGSPSASPGSPAPGGSPGGAAGNGQGLKGEYFSNSNLASAPAAIRTDAQVNFTWNNGAPLPAVAADNFSVRWTGQIHIPATGHYRFRTSSDDGVRLWIENTLLIDNWTIHGATLDESAPMPLTAGRPVNVRMEYYEKTGLAEARLGWLRPGQATPEWIPSHALRPAQPPFHAKINFQPANSAVPAGYHADSGLTFGPRHGLNYGWSADVSPWARERGRASDKRLDTLVHMQSSGSRTWELAVPSGTYQVTLVAGDPAYADQVNALTIEGVAVADSNGQDHFDTIALSVAVSDGRLTVAPGPKAFNAKLCYIEVQSR